MKRRLVFVCSLLLLLAAIPAYPQSSAPLRIVSAGPAGEVASAAEAKEIRVVFSESMVAIGRVPAQLRPAFFHITPAVAGTFRWSGTTILIFSPSRTLPLATEYAVTIDGTATALSGRTLGQPFTFRFRTPTVRLLRTNWYRPGGRYDARMLVGLNFNQSIEPADQRGEEQVVLVGEMVVEDADGQLGRVGDVPTRDRARAVVRQERLGRVEQAAADLFRRWS